jgi:hypothetical protein
MGVRYLPMVISGLIGTALRSAWRAPASQRDGAGCDERPAMAQCSSF